MNAKINNMLTEIVKHYSFEEQREIFIEECAEAIKAVQKCKRANAPEEMLSAFENFCEEVANVCVMAEQMKRYIGAEKVEAIMRDKLKRQLNRLGIDNIPVAESVEDKHWNECMQIALYSDELRECKSIINRQKAEIEELKKLKENAKRIQENCDNFPICVGCLFALPNGGCVFEETTPSNWKLNNIKEEMVGEDNA